MFLTLKVRRTSVASRPSTEAKTQVDSSTVPTPLATRMRGLLREAVQGLRRQYFNRVWHMDLGEGSVVSFSAKLDMTNPRGIHIGKYSVVAFGAAVLAHDYVNSRHRDVHIGDNCFIGAHAIVLPGVTIGDQCIVAAGTVVARDVPAGSLVAGNPARVVERNVRTGHYGVRMSTELYERDREEGKGLTHPRFTQF